jgi:hypothetical protein
MSDTNQANAPIRGASPVLEEPPWQWPIDSARYDRTARLSPAEVSALAVLGDDVRTWRNGTRSEFQLLHRLLRPLIDARAALDTPNRRFARCADAAVARLLRCCAQEGQSYWGFSAPTWVQVLGATQHDFQAAHPGWVDRTTRPYLMGLAYLLGCFTELRRLGTFKRLQLAEKVFGPERVRAALETLEGVLRQWGYQRSPHDAGFPRVVSEVLLWNASPRLGDLTPAVLDVLRTTPTLSREDHALLHQLERGLVALGLIAAVPAPRVAALPVEGVHATWQSWVERWEAGSPLTPRTRRHVRIGLLKAGRWLAGEHPTIPDPASWTRDLCAAYVAAVNGMQVGAYTQRPAGLASRFDQPLSARSKDAYLGALRQFFRDCQEWGWIPRRFDPSRALATPRSTKALIGPEPRVIADEVWAKLLWAGINFDLADLPTRYRGSCFYPLELVRSLALTWLFGGLRSNEIVRLRVGCILMSAGRGDRSG